MPKAYILSRQYGTVQIGKTVFQPVTGAIFDVKKPRKKNEALAVYEVPDASMESARQALRRDAEKYL